MKPTKQTVYLPKAAFPTSVVGIASDLFKIEEGYFFTPEQLNEYTKSVIKQSVETAAEKVEKKVIEIDGCDDHTPYRGACGTCGHYHMPKIEVISIDKQSITNTFEETFNKFKQ
jgi:hypothetical protein